MSDAADIALAGMAAGAAQKFDEFVQLVELVEARKPQTVLEIGTMAGGTLRAWCACAAPDALVLSVDLPDGAWGGGYGEADIPRIEGYRQPGQRLELIRSDSHLPSTRQQVVEALDGREIDFLFIDGDHTLPGVRQDFGDYAPFVRIGGLVAFHDILPHPLVPGCDVDVLWAEDVRGRYATTWEFTVVGDERGHGSWGGIGVLEWDGRRRAGVSDVASRYTF